MALFKRGRIWWFEVLFHGQRIQKGSKSESKTVARAAEADHRRQLERTLAGMPMEDRGKRVQTVAAAVAGYLEDYALTHRPQSILFVTGRLQRVVEALGGVMLHERTEDRIQAYQRERKAAGVTGRTINAELGELSRALGGRQFQTARPKATSRISRRCLPLRSAARRRGLTIRRELPRISPHPVPSTASAPHQRRRPSRGQAVFWRSLNSSMTRVNPARQKRQADRYMEIRKTKTEALRRRLPDSFSAAESTLTY